MQLINGSLGSRGSVEITRQDTLFIMGDTDKEYFSSDIQEISIERSAFLYRLVIGILVICFWLLMTIFLLAISNISGSPHPQLAPVLAFVLTVILHKGLNRYQKATAYIDFTDGSYITIQLTDKELNNFNKWRKKNALK